MYVDVIGPVAELADALDLGSSGEIREGSNPSGPTNILRRIEMNDLDEWDDFGLNDEY